MRPAHLSTSALRIDKITVGPFENNAFIVRCLDTGEAVLIDAANEHELLIPLATRFGVRRVLTTHGHWDHIQAVTAARDAGLDIAVSAADAGMLPSYDIIIEPGELLVVGNLHLRAIATPGHTPGSLCFVLQEAPVCFSGDTLFPGGPGTTALPGGNFEAIIASIDQSLFPLSGDTLVLPGHGLDTTIGCERPHIAEWATRGW
ncbi:MAG: MBL fold metallo-hydrolase [Acidimicrobiia bacterium]